MKKERKKKKKNFKDKKELENKKLSDAKKQKEMLEKAEKRATYLDKKEERLNDDEKKIDNEFDLAQRLLSSAKDDLDKAISKEDMVGIKVAREMVESASKKLEAISAHISEQQTLREEIGSKRKCAFDKLMKSCKKSK